MANFGKRSKINLASATEDLQNLFNEVVKSFDCSIIYGYRTPEEQLELFKQGRELISGKWVKTGKQSTITNCDGIMVLSNHNYLPSKAVDVVPYFAQKPHIRWDDKESFYHFAGYVKGVANSLGINVVWGGDWDSDNYLHDQVFYDLIHFELN